MRLLKYEQEAIINFNVGDPDVSSFTLDPAVMRKSNRLTAAYPDVYH